jgi:hypothetical protein
MGASPDPVPPILARGMRAALGTVGGDPADPRTGLAAAEACLRRALERIDDRAAALDLLAADALLTAACAAAAAAGGVGPLAAEATTRLAALVATEADR